MSLFQAHPQLAGNPAPTPNGGGDNQPFAKSDTWANIIVEIPMKDEDGKDVVESISLPMGVALQHLKPKTVFNSKNKAVVDRLQAQNAILDYFQKSSEALQPGERKILPEFKVEIYKKAGEIDEAGTPDTNPMLAALGEVFNPVKKAS